MWLATAGGDSVAATVGDSHPDIANLEVDDNALFWNVLPHGGPQGVWDPVTARTWLAFTATGGDLYATYYDHAAGELAAPQLVATFPFGAVDFHHFPAVALDADGIMHIIYGGHNDQAHRHYRMDSARDLSAWTGQVLTNGTYPFACSNADGSELFFTDRPGDSHGAFPAHGFGAIHRCTDGSTWTRTEIVDTTDTPETISDFYQCDLMWAGGLVHLIWTVARGDVHDDEKSDLYYAAYDPDTATLTNAAGDALGAVITWAEHGDCWVDTVTATTRIRASLAWHQGAPAIAYNSTTDADLEVAVWTGSAWSKSTIHDGAAYRERPVIHSTGDELSVLTYEETENPSAGQALDIVQWRLIDGTWQNIGTVLNAEQTWYLSPLHDGPGWALALNYDTSSGFPGDVDDVLGELRLITGHHHTDHTIAIEDDGVSILAGARTLDFTGTGVVVTDLGNGKAGVAIAGGGGGGGSASHQARMYRSTSWTITSVGANVAVPFDSDSYDVSGATDGAGVYTCPETGYYDIRGRVDFGTSPAGIRFIGVILINGVEASRGGDAVAQASSEEVILPVNDVLHCTAGDEITFGVFQVSGAAEDIIPGEIHAFMTIYML